MNYGSEPADQVVRYSLEGAEFALRISGTAAKNFFIFAQAVLHDSKKTHGKTHLIRLLKEQKPLKFFTVDKDRMHDFARAAKAHGLLFCPIRDKMDPDHIEIAILQDDASKANRIIEKLQLDVVDTGTAELVDAVQQNLENAAPNHEDTPAVGFPRGSESASPSEPFSDSSKSFANSPSPRADQLRTKGERPSVRMELSDITAYLCRKVEPLTGESCFLVMPYCNTACMNLFLRELSKQFPQDTILMCCDGAAWHKSGTLEVPENIVLFHIPPYTPEMNPIEQIWKEIRKRGFRNEVFATLEKVVDRLCDTICSLTPNTIFSITGRDWIIKAFN